MGKKHWAEARDLLEELDRRSPGQPEVLTDLVNAYYELHDMEGYQGASERLIKVDRDNADLALGLAGAYLQNARVALALRAFRQFLQRWPDHPRAGEARQTVADLEAALPALLAQMDVPADQSFEVAVQHELVQSLLAQGQYRETRQAAESLLRRYPRFAPALNNLSLAHWSDGRLDQAIAAAGRALELEPDNVHALSNLIRFLCAAGRQAEARPYAGRLKASPAPAADVWLKKIEGLSYIGDDPGVLDVFHQAEESIEPHSPQFNAMLHHLVAVAAWRLGREAEARGYWQRALKLSPGFALARENLDDLKLPPGERHGPWAFTLPYWISPPAIRDLARLLEPVSKPGADDEAVVRAARRYVREHPQVVKVTPLLLERGDRQGREFALRMASMAKTPELLAMLKEFAFGQRGPDQARLDAAQIVNQAGLLPSGPVRLWMRGEWQELLLLGFEIYPEPEGANPHSARVTQWLEEATLALRAGDVKRAEPLLRQALAEEPDAPDLLNNLAAAYSLQGRRQESEALVREIHARHPDYFFGRANLARLLAQAGDYDRARELLDPLLQQKRLHITEFDSLCAAEIDLFLAQGNLDAARTWFSMWESADTDSPMLEQFRRRIGVSRRKPGLPAGRPGRLKRFLGG